LIAQKNISELINNKESGWDLVLEWKKSAKNAVELLPIDSQERAEKSLLQVQVTTRSPMGAIIYHSGGILIDGGWIRILGSGSKKLDRGLMEWNKGKTFKEFGEKTPFLLVGDDVIGGFFALNGGGLGKDVGKIYYLAPESLEWEALEWTYTEFITFCFEGDLKGFYKNLRWRTWKEDLLKIDGNMTFNFYPPLWTKEGKNIEKASKKPVPTSEQYSLSMDFRKQILGN
jgi:hypothetical protein